MRTAVRVVPVALATLLVLAGCAGVGAPKGTPSPTPTRAVPAEPASAFAFHLAPLTGQLVAATEAIGPSLAAKIDNHPDARPQWALNQTDLVFEELVEGGLTRYVAVWQSRIPSDIGPVRSIRPMDPDIISPLGGIVAYSGGQAQFVSMMRAAPVVNVSADAGDAAFYRVKGRVAPHNELLKAADVVREHADIPAPPALFQFGSVAVVAQQAGTPATRIDLAFSSGSKRSWEWDAATASWLRAQSGVPDSSFDEGRVRASNVIVLRVAIDWRYGIVPKTVMVDSGEALVAIDGRVIRGTWSKASQTAPIVLRDAAGAVITLRTGNSWIELVPRSGSLTAG
ncbi:MAG: DUF3048 domain-containing protein [Agromyces sp.]